MSFTLGKITIRQAMVAVLVVAVLTPFPFDALGYVCTTLVFFWIPFLMLVWPFDRLFADEPRSIRKNLSNIAAPVAGILMIIWLFLGGSGCAPIYVIAMIVYSFGPVFVAYRVRMGKRISGGHLVMAWCGLVLSAQVWEAAPIVSHRSMVLHYTLMSEFCRLTFSIAIISLYLPRPDRQDKVATISHYLGWLLVEGLMVIWGVDAAHKLEYL